MKFIRSYGLLALLLVLLSYLFYKDIYKLPPSYVHAWTQGDRLAIALGFTENGFDLFHPVTYNLNPLPNQGIFNREHGITGVDLPIHEFIIAAAIAISNGDASAIFRIYVLLYALAGLVFLYKTCLNYTKSNVKSFFVTAFVFTAPVYTYYQCNFLPTIPSLANVFIGFYFLMRYYQLKVINDYFLALVFFTLAALSRTPFAVVLVTLFMKEGLQVFLSRKISWKVFVGLIASFIIIVSYSFYNGYLSTVYGTLFLRKLMPAGSWDEFLWVIKQTYDTWILQYFSYAHYILLLIACVFVFVRSFKERKLKVDSLLLLLLIITAGMSMYFVLMATQFVAHDYYFLDSFFICFVLLLIWLMKHVKISNKILWPAFFAFAFFSAYASYGIQKERYTFQPWDRTEVTRKNFEFSRELLDSLSIPTNSKILVIDAYSTNNPLSAMRRKGYTVQNTSFVDIHNSLKWNYDFVVIQDIYLVSDIVKNYPFITRVLKRVGGNGKISVFKRDELLKRKSLFEFLGLTEQNVKLRTTMNFDSSSSQQYWNNHMIDSARYVSAPYGGFVDEKNEFGATLQITGEQVDISANKIHIHFKAYAEEKPDGMSIVVSMSDQNEQYHYVNMNLNDYIKNFNEWEDLDFVIPIPGFKGWKDELKCFIYNPSGKRLWYDDIEIILTSDLLN